MNIQKLKSILNNVNNNGQVIFLLERVAGKGAMFKFNKLTENSIKATVRVSMMDNDDMDMIIETSKEKDMMIFDDFSRGTTEIQNLILLNLEKIESKYITFVVNQHDIDRLGDNNEDYIFESESVRARLSTINM